MTQVKHKYKISLNYQGQVYDYYRWITDSTKEEEDYQALILGVIALEKEIGRVKGSLISYFMKGKNNYEVKRV